MLRVLREIETRQANIEFLLKRVLEKVDGFDIDIQNLLANDTALVLVVGNVLTLVQALKDAKPVTQVQIDAVRKVSADIETAVSSLQGVLPVTPPAV